MLKMAKESFLRTRRHILKTLTTPGGGVASQARKPKAQREVFLAKVRPQVSDTFEPRTVAWLDGEGAVLQGCMMAAHSSLLALAPGSTPGPVSWAHRTDSPGTVSRRELSSTVPAW